jgi:AraC-like DNA-binding protein
VSNFTDLDAIVKAPSFTDPNGTYVADTCAPLREAGRKNDIGLWAYGRGSYPGVPMDPGILPQLRNVGMWEVTNEQPWGLDWHRNEGIEFTCVTAGRIPFSCEKEDFDLGAGSISVTRPWQLHRVGRPNVASSTLTWFILDVEVRRPNQDWIWPTWLPIPGPDLRRLTELLSHNEIPVWRATKGLLSAVGTLQRTLRDNASQPMARIATSISEIFIELGDLLEQQEPHLDPYLSSTERTVQLFLDRLPERLHEGWSVDQMADECGLGRTRFVHYCRQMLNITPLQYLMAARVTRARELLLGTDAQVSDIAQLCGFQSSQYFATVFRRQTGMSPGDLRRAA